MFDALPPVSDIAKILIFLFTVGGGGGIFGWLIKAKREGRAERRLENRAPIDIGAATAELADRLIAAAKQSVDNAVAETARAREEAQLARDEANSAKTAMASAVDALERAEHDIREQRNVIDRLQRRVKQLVDVITRAGLSVPEEEKYIHPGERNRR